MRPLGGAEVATLLGGIDRPHQLHVLLRHRPPSIPSRRTAMWMGNIARIAPDRTGSDRIGERAKPAARSLDFRVSRHFTVPSGTPAALFTRERSFVRTQPRTR